MRPTIIQMCNTCHRIYACVANVVSGFPNGIRHRDACGDKQHFITELWKWEEDEGINTA